MKSYHDLLVDLWSYSPSMDPYSFKRVIGRHATQFSGYDQNDSHEFIATLLDKVHEDLNRVKGKPYIEQREAGDTPDEIASKEAWDDHLARNDSMIVDLFHGQLKSTITCPDCDRTSIKFDPLMYLTVPIPKTIKIQGI